MQDLKDVLEVVEDMHQAACGRVAAYEELISVIQSMIDDNVKSRR